MESRKRMKLDENAVIDNFSCNVCNELPKAHIFQCKEGHIMCKECYENPHLKNKCPGCRGKLPPPSQRIRNLVVQNFLDRVIKVECPYKENGCEYEASRDLEDESHHATCFYNFEKYGPLVNLCQKLGYTSCNYQLNNGKGTAAIDHFQSQHSFHLATSPFIMVLENFKNAITLRSSPHFWTPIIAKLPEGQGHVMLVPILNRNEDFACLSVLLPDPHYCSPSVPQPPIRVEFEFPETKNSECFKIIFDQDTLTLAKAMEASLENLTRPMQGRFLKDHMRNEKWMMMLCKIKGNGSSSRETDLVPFLCKMNCPLQEPATEMTEKTLKWLDEEEAKAKVDRDNLWEFLINLFDKSHKPDGYSYQEITLVKDTAFHLVLRQGTAAQLNFLKNKGLNMGNGFEYSGLTALHYVLERENDQRIALEKVKILVNTGMDFNDLDCLGESILHYASFYGNLQTVKYCLEELKLDANAADSIGAIPLHVAVRNPNEDCALKITQLLLDHGANPQMKTKDGGDLLTFASPNYKEKLEEILCLHQAKKSRKQFMCSLLSERF